MMPYFLLYLGIYCGGLDGWDISFLQFLLKIGDPIEPAKGFLPGFPELLAKFGGFAEGVLQGFVCRFEQSFLLQISLPFSPGPNWGRTFWPFLAFSRL